MPRNATTGVYTRVANSFSQPVEGTIIDNDDAMLLFNDQDNTGFNNLPVNLLSTSVKTFGAVGNGVADDTVAIQAALNDATTGVIYFPRGTYMVNATGLTGTSSKIWVGDGIGVSIIKASATPTVDFILFSAKTNFGFKNLTFDGNALLTKISGTTYGTLQPCIYLATCTRCFVRDCEFIGFYTLGLLTNSTHDVVIDGCRVTRTTATTAPIIDFPGGAYGIFVAGTAVVGAGDAYDFIVNNNVVTNCNIAIGGHDGSITNNVITGWGFSAGINSQANAANLNLRIENNICYNSNQAADGAGYLPAGIENWAKQSSIIGNICYGNWGSGIDNGGNNCTISGNVCYNNGAGGGGAGGISMYANDATVKASGCIIEGNRCTDTRAGGARTQAYGYYEHVSLTTFTAANIVVGVNDFEGNLTGQMSLQTITRLASAAVSIAMDAQGGTVGGFLTNITSFSLKNGTKQLIVAPSGVFTADRTLSVILNDADRLINLGGNITLAGPLVFPAAAQGDLFYGSAAGTLSALAKDANATRYLSNQGTTNNPSWNQVNLANGVTGRATFANIPQTSAYTLVGNNSNGTADVAGFTVNSLTQKTTPATSDLAMIVDQAASGAFKYATLGSLISAISHKLQVNLSAGQTPSSGVKTKIQFNTEVLDPDNWYDNVTNFRYTPLVAGSYLVNVQVSVSGTTVSSIALSMIYKNGSEYAEGVGIPSATNGASTCMAIVAMNGTTDYIEGWGRVTAAGSPAFDGGTAPIFTWMSITYLGP